MVRKQYVCLWIFSIILVLAACSPAQPTPPATVAPNGSPSGTPYAAPGSTSSTYPYPGAEVSRVVNPYPAGQEPVTPTDMPLPTPTYDAQMGIVRGRLLEAHAPVKDLIIFLAEIKKDAKGSELADAFSATDSPRMKTDANGEFVFVNVMPGRYSVVLYSGENAWLLNVPDSKDPIMFTVEAGKTSDLGDLDYDDIPLN